MFLLELFCHCKENNAMDKLKRNLLLWPFVILLFSVFTGCSSSNVRTSVADNSNLQRYRTYSWLPAKVSSNNPEYNSEILNDKIRNSVENELAARGMMRNDENPDVRIAFNIYTEQRQGVYSSSSPYYGGFYGPGFYPYYYGSFGPYYGGYWGWGGSTISTYNYTEGTLILDMVDAHTNQHVWRGASDREIDDDTPDKDMVKMVHKIMDEFPVKEHK